MLVASSACPSALQPSHNLLGVLIAFAVRRVGRGLSAEPTLPLQRRPHGAVALGGPDAGCVDALGLVVGARDVEGLAVLEDRPAAVLGAHGGSRLVEALLQ